MNCCRAMFGRLTKSVGRLVSNLPAILDARLWRDGAVNCEMSGRDKSDALKTTSNDLGSGLQDDVFIDSDIGAIADMGMQVAMEFLTTDKVIVSLEDVEEEKNKENFKEHLEGNEGEAKVKSDSFVEIKEESMPNPGKEKDDKESIREHEVIKLEEAANEESIGDVVVTNICN
ncbi:hypothetical protein TIFTF001_016614 [Ficus carica]|uniref:Uncharacterized protein n=1 Tax=Ficus carica TaxID=3494 RepID=A0AA88A7V3_FICCA|nr:hypothetical protein TIFTF001_016614 [Ficus carica]